MGAGIRHSPALMLRVGQSSTPTCSIRYSMESKNRYHTTRKSPRVERKVMPRDRYRLTVDYLLLLSFLPFLLFLRESDSELHHIYFDRINPSPRRLTLYFGHEETFRVRFLTFRLNQASRASRGMAKCLLHVLYVATDRRSLSQLLLLYA